MKTILQLTMICSMFFGSFYTTAQSFQWAKSMGGTGTDFGHSIAVDGWGNVYTTGMFWDTVDFDPGPGTFNLTSAGLYDIFVSKLDANGNFIWAKAMGGTDFTMANSITTDLAGNVYTTGIFWGTADFDPGPDTFSLTSAGVYDIFISKLDSSGNFVWAKSMGGTGWDQGNSITTDAAGNVYTTGFFTNTVDFDPGPGIFILTSAGSYDIFISKLDSSGNFVWAKQMGGTDVDFGSSIAIDGGGNVYTTGNFRNTVDFDPGPGTFNLTSAGLGDIFVSKLDPSGNFVWAKQMGGSVQSEGNGYSIAIDGGGNVYTTGHFQGIVDFDPGPGTFNLTSAVLGDIFVSKLDPSGNFVWAKQMGGLSNVQGHSSIALDGLGNVYTTGSFEGIVDFDPGPGTFNLTSAGLWDIFISKLDSSGNFVWAKSMGGTDYDVGHSIAVDGGGNVYTTGYYSGTADFDPGPGTFNLTSAGPGDIFVSKLGIIAEIKEKTITDKFLVYPNPTNGLFTIERHSTQDISYHYEIKDISGRSIRKGRLSDKLTTIDLCEFDSGVYLLQIDGKTVKLVKQ